MRIARIARPDTLPLPDNLQQAFVAFFRVVAVRPCQPKSAVASWAGELGRQLHWWKSRPSLYDARLLDCIRDCGEAGDPVHFSASAVLQHGLKVQVKDVNAGTFGFVQLAEDIRTGEEVAVKFMERGEGVRISRPNSCYKTRIRTCT